MMPSSRATGGKREFAVAVVAIALGGGLALLAAARPWDHITVLRTAPLGPVAVAVSGRTIAPGVVGLAVVALAGVVALLATRGYGRTIMGVALTVTGGLLCWQAVTGFTAVSATRARTLVADARTGVVLTSEQPFRITTSPQWPALALVGAVIVVLGGALVTVRGAHWFSMSARYESPTAAPAPVRADPNPLTPSRAARPSAPAPDDAEALRAKADLALWQSLERGEDPTADVEV